MLGYESAAVVTEPFRFLALASGGALLHTTSRAASCVSGQVLPAPCAKTETVPDEKRWSCIEKCVHRISSVGATARAGEHRSRSGRNLNLEARWIFLTARGFLLIEAAHPNPTDVEALSQLG